MTRRRGRQRNRWAAKAVGAACFVVALLAGWPGVGLADQADRSPPCPEILFEWEGPAGWAASQRCLAVLESRGPDLAAAIMPPGKSPAPIRCLMLDSEAFRERFGGRLPDWGIGTATSDGKLIALDCQRRPGAGRNIEELFLHELTHALVFQATEGAWLPTWFHEGVALWYSGEWKFLDTVAVVLNGGLPPLWKLGGPFPATAAWADQAYRTSLLAVEALRDDYGPDIVARLVEGARRTGDFDTAFAQVTGEPTDLFADRFAGKMKLRFGWLFTLTRWPGLFVLLALLFAAAAIARLIRNRRRLAALADEPPGPLTSA